MKLYWQTMNGDKWLSEVHPDCHGEDLLAVVADYYRRTVDAAERYTYGWRLNGQSAESATLYPSGENDDRDWRGSYAIDLAFKKVEDQHNEQTDSND